MMLATVTQRLRTALVAAGEPVINAAGIALKAADTGRVLMHQRPLDDDNAPGGWEFPGGHCDPDEDPYAAACREFEEEMGIPVPDGAALVSAEVAEQGGFILFVVMVPHEVELAGGQEEEAGIGNCAWFDPADIEGSDILRPEAKDNDWEAIKEATMPEPTNAPPSTAVVAAGKPRRRKALTAAGTDPVPPEAPEPQPEATPDPSAWADPETAVLCLISDVSVLPTGFDPDADPPPFVVIGAVADLDRVSAVAAICAAVALDDEEDEQEDANGDGPEVFVLVWGDPSKPENLTVIPEDSDDTEPEEAPAEEPTMAAAATLGATEGSVTDKSWDGSAGRFTDEQYQRAAAACDPASKGTVKSRCFLPHHEPDGTISRAGVHAAAQRVGSLSGRSPDAVATAKGHLRSHYTKDLQEEPPDSIATAAVTAAAPPPQDGIPVPLPEPEWEALILTEGEPTDDGRTVAPGALRWRPLPLSFTFQPIDSPDAHDDAPVGGAMTEIARDGNMVMARGIYAQGPLGDTCRAMVADPGMPLAPSVRVAEDSLTMQLTISPAGQHVTVMDGLLLNFCIVPVEAQATTWIRNLVPAMAVMPDVPMEPVMACACEDSRDSWRFTGALIACAAGNGAPVHPPESWFDFPPELAEGPPKALQITAGGRIFGNLAGPGCHLAKPNQCLTVGATSRDFTLFHHGGDDPDGGIVTAEGTRLRVGALTLSGGHAGLRASADEAMAHYDDPARVGAFLRAGWDSVHNLPYIAGAVLPRVSEEDLQVMRALGVSGDWRVKEDWRTIDGKRTLVGLALVPVPGWPVAWRQAIVASGVLEAEVVDTFGALQADMVEPETPEPEPVAASAWLLAAAADGMAAEILRPEWEAEAKALAGVMGV